MTRISLSSASLALIVILSTVPGHAATGPTVSPSPDRPKFVGAVTCESSMCHGGASPSRCQFTIWSNQDAHSRAYATLVTAYATNMSRALGISSPTTDARCTTCHAPMANLSAAQAALTVNPTEGVSCENCHNAAGFWLRGHTRPDWTYADRVSAGLRDLRDTFVRAKTCVACHQTIDPALVAAGHPKLTFELDGQDASEPRHWKEKADWFGPKAWLVGQAVALTQISETVGGNKSSADDVDDQKALLWLLHQVPGIDNTASTPDQRTTLAAWSNQLAHSVSAAGWNPETSRQVLAALAGTSAGFTDTTVPVAEREKRAERLVLGLDRVFKSLHIEPNAAGSDELAALFNAVSDPAHFDPAAFANSLQKFAVAVR